MPFFIPSANIANAFASAVDYQWCYTDRRGKNPRQMRNKNHDGTKREDYFLGQNFRGFTQAFFNTLGLPMPNDEMIYRGNSQDLLFLDNMGLIIRTGPLDVVDLMHPGILQPLFWLPLNKHTDHVIAIYPGVQLPEQIIEHDVYKQNNFNNDRHKLVSFLEGTRQNTLDKQFDQNFGYVDGRLVVIDAEHSFFGSMGYEIGNRKKAAFQTYLDADMSPHVALRMAMTEIYSHRSEFSKWIQTYDYHQPLRQQFHNAMTERACDKKIEKLGLFYQRCRKLVQKAERYQIQDWSVRIKGHDKIWIKNQNPIQELALYKPWTGNINDNKTKRSYTPVPKHR